MRVSDHALLRFLQRELGIDVDAYRSQISAICRDAVRSGDTEVRAGDLRFLINPYSKTVKTVIPVPLGAPGNLSPRVTLAAVWPREEAA